MRARALRIGVSSCYFHADPKRAIFKGKTLLYLEQSLAQWLHTYDARPCLIPGGASYAADWAEELDGLILQGGSDVAPSSYGDAALRPEWEGDAIRDQHEVELIREFIARRKPIFGVCRGAQVLNIALGGTLIQDIATQLDGALVHRDWEVYDRNKHELRFEQGSRLSELYPISGGVRVNSIHHQAIGRLGEGLVVEARSPVDGVIEAIRLEGPAYAFGVQWHPEFQVAGDGLLPREPLMADFLSAVQQRKRDTA